MSTIIKEIKPIIIGYGAQAKSWSKNLKSSGIQPIICLRKQSNRWPEVLEDGFKVISLNDVKNNDFNSIILLTPDNTHDQILKKILPPLKEHTRIIYAHGYSMTQHRFYETYPNISHLLLAPKAIANEVRSRFLNNNKIPAAYSLEFSRNLKEDEDYLFSLSRLLGFTAGPYKCNFKDETFADLFSEQSILCSTLPYIMKESFDRLVNAGVPEEIAYLECCFEVKLIANTLIEKGPKQFFELISPNALVGGEKARKKLINDQFKENLDQLLNDITSMKFFDEIDRTDFNELKKETVNEWSNSKFNQVYERMAPQLQ